MAVPKGARTEIFPSLMFSSLGNTNVNSMCSPLSRSSSSTRVFIVITSKGTSSGATIRACLSSFSRSLNSHLNRPDSLPVAVIYRTEFSVVRRGDDNIIFVVHFAIFSCNTLFSSRDCFESPIASRRERFAILTCSAGDAGFAMILCSFQICLGSAGAAWVS